MITNSKNDEIDYYEQELKNIFSYFDVEDDYNLSIDVLMTHFLETKSTLSALKHETYTHQELQKKIRDHYRSIKTTLFISHNVILNSSFISQDSKVLMITRFLQSHFFMALQRLNIELLEALYPSYAFKREGFEEAFNSYKEKWISFFNAWIEPKNKPKELDKMTVEIVSYLDSDKDIFSLLKKKSLVNYQDEVSLKKDEKPSKVIVSPLLKNGTFSLSAITQIKTDKPTNLTI